ncbi:MAG: Glu-tRNA(Gln) amidotransferase subunit GatE [Candidatus Hydrothermarchaeota archaeon]|nr:Glu-tRNA(Gln) amidotransferase subunit GatE [Candidatus Hydrothermarchaeota archaeon]
MLIGFEIHQQLETHKLFCKCPSLLKEEKPEITVERRLRPTQSELGEIDRAALEEFLKGKSFVYEVYLDTICLVELDEEPPHEPNEEAIDICTEIALMLKCNIVDEVHFMRKLVIDGSNTSGFQRTAIVALDGYLETDRGRVGIPTICLEEEAARKIAEEGKKTIYRLDRLGIPLIEITTAPDITTPEQAREVALKIGEILRATGKVKRGIGTIRQDINVSIEGGARVEIKGVQELNQIPKIIENEVERQKNLIDAIGGVPEETRAANPDATTSYMRPLPGAARMYPETDIPPIVITPERVNRIRAKLPELYEEKKRRYIESHKLSEEMASQLLASSATFNFGIGKKPLWKFYDEIVKEIKITPSIAANTLLGTLKDLKREGYNVESISDEKLKEVFRLVAENRIAKEAIPEVLTAIAENPKQKVEEALKLVGTKSFEKEEIAEIVRNVLKAREEFVREKGLNAAKPLMGAVMKEMRGKVDGKTVNEILQKELKKFLKGKS